MESTSVIGTIIALLTATATYRAFKHMNYYESNIFFVDKILVDGEYRRLLTSGFLHANWLHFGFNIGTLLAFSFSLEMTLGYLNFLILYFGSLLGGSLLALYIHRNHGDYRALGASGAISGVVLASVILFPNSSIHFFLLPLEIKSWLFGALFILISIFGIKAQRDNIGHEAHLGGAITGILIALILAPDHTAINWLLVFGLLVPVAIFLYLVVTQPAILMIDNYWGSFERPKKAKPKKKKQSPQEELNALLDKIREGGIKSLSDADRKRLDELKDKM